MSVLLAELIREYLDFYQLDYTKQIFLPESNLMTHESSSKEQLADKANLGNADEKKPLLLQMLEKFLQGDMTPSKRNNILANEQKSNNDDMQILSSMKAKNNMSSSASPDKSDNFVAKSSAAKGSGTGIQFSDDKNE